MLPNARTVPFDAGMVGRRLCVRQRRTHANPRRGFAIEVAGSRCDQTGGPAVADSPNPQPAETLERLGPMSLRELSMDSLLQTVADLTKSVMPGNPEASVL